MIRLIGLVHVVVYTNLLYISVSRMVTYNDNLYNDNIISTNLYNPLQAINQTTNT